MKRIMTVLGLCLFLIPAVFAGIVVFDNGGPNQQNGNEMTNWIQVENFVRGQNTLITDVHFWSIEVQSAYAGSIWYGIYGDNGGSPNLGAPAIEGFAAGTNPSRTATGNTPLGLYDEYAYSFDITPFTALAGVTYWLGLHNGDLSNTTRADFYWETADGNGTITGNEDVLPPAGDSWSNNGQEHAFQLTSAVPEPATMALLGAGLAGLALMRRRWGYTGAQK